MFYQMSYTITHFIRYVAIFWALNYIEINLLLQCVRINSYCCVKSLKNCKI
jgi:hypothetical protein